MTETRASRGSSERAKLIRIVLHRGELFVGESGRWEIKYREPVKTGNITSLVRCQIERFLSGFERQPLGLDVRAERPVIT